MSESSLTLHDAAIALSADLAAWQARQAAH
jgi:hypothetical protein